MRGVQVCEGQIEEVVIFDTEEEMNAYRQGFSDGAGKYGAGYAAVYDRNNLPDEEDSNHHLRSKIERLIQGNCHERSE